MMLCQSCKTLRSILVNVRVSRPISAVGNGHKISIDYWTSYVNVRPQSTYVHRDEKPRKTIQTTQLEDAPKYYCDPTESVSKRTDPSQMFSHSMEENHVEDTSKATHSCDNSTKSSAAKTITRTQTPGNHTLRLEHLHQSIKSSINMCFYLNLPKRALATLKHHRLEKSRSSSETFDVFLKEAAHIGNWDLICDALLLMKNNKIPMTANSFSACFECLGRMVSVLKLPEVTSLSEDLVKNLRRLGFEVNDIFQTGSFVSDGWEKTIQGVQLALPDFQPARKPLFLTYSSSLLEELNNVAIEKDVESPAKGLLTDDELSKAASEQFKSELAATVEIDSIRPAQPKSADLPNLDVLENEWQTKIEAAFKRDLSVCRSSFISRGDGSLHIYPYLAVLSTNEYVNLIMQEVRMLSRSSEVYSPSVQLLSKNLGLKVMQRFHIKTKKRNGILDKMKNVYRQYWTWYLNVTQSGTYFNPRQQWQNLLETNQVGLNIDFENIVWPHSSIVAVGNFMYNIILNDLKIKSDDHDSNSSSIPAFYTVYRTEQLKIKKGIKPHPNVTKYYFSGANNKLTFESALLPMVSPPMPWYSYRSGGYLLSEVPLMRLPPYAIQQKLRLEQLPYQQLYPALDALNYLGSIPWKINDSILDIVVKVFNENGSKEFDIPQPPDVLNSQDLKIISNKEKQALRVQKAEMYSIWMDTLYRLSIANHFRGKIFWFPHNMDFRGRVYPCSPHLTHLSSDLARSILHFAQGKPLGKDGFNWLKIHLINLTGKKKRDPISERLIYADEVMPEILDSARNPLTGRKWWLQSDEPWQTLAACVEVASAIDSGDPESYVSHLPIHQDGSCNGLQHYAALGRDSVGAKSVNLAPSDRPQDVYSNVAVLVERERAKDAEADVQIAKVLEGHINRKVIKQTVMTTVYGVTKFGARLQIVKQIKDIPNFPPEQIFPASSYLVGKTFSSLQEMFTSAKEIQDWFTECAKLICSVQGKSVEWVTPLGLPVVQPYNKSQKKLEGVVLPNQLKQRNAFPPNFIHSLDSSHMMLTGLFSQRKGITFASVHDCFWTHACTVNTMNEVCREQFLSLHSEPILEDLSMFFQDVYGYDSSDLTAGDTEKQRLNRVITEVPRRGNFDLRQVLDSVYFFS